MTIASRLRAAFGTNRSTPAERYLNEATSIADLEQREREVARGRFSGRRNVR